MHFLLSQLTSAIIKIKAGTKSRNENEHYKLGRFTLDAKHATLYNDETEEKRC